MITLLTVLKTIGVLYLLLAVSVGYLRACKWVADWREARRMARLTKGGAR